MPASQALSIHKNSKKRAAYLAKRTATIAGKIVGGAANSSIMLEASTDLSPDSWQTIATIPLGQDGTADFGPISVDGSENTHKCFFRCRFKTGQVK